MAKKGTQENFLIRRLSQYLSVTRGKVVVWGIFLFPYLFILVVFSRVTPRWVQVWVYEQSNYLRNTLPSPLPTTSRQLAPANVDFEQLTLSYFLLTYLWSCIVMESFGIIHPRSRKRKM